MDMRMLVLVSLALPALYILVGIAELMTPPDRATALFGYRSRRSCLSQESWDYANHSFGVVCIFTGIYLAFATALVDALARYGTGPQRKVVLGAVLIAQLLTLLYPIYHTEHQLKIYFDDKGELLFPEEIDFEDRKTDDDWEDWDQWPEDGKWDDWNSADSEPDGWESWEDWMRRRDRELDVEREKRKIDKTDNADSIK